MDNIIITDSDEKYNNDMNVRTIPLPTTHIPSNFVMQDQIYEKYDYKYIGEHFFNEGRLSYSQLSAIFKASQTIFLEEANLLRIDKPVYIIGDIHGQFYDLYNLLSRFDLNEDTLVFLGDYVDRGQFSVEVYLYLLVLKINFPENIYLLRGNHESERMTTYFTFKTECLYKYDIEAYNMFIKNFCHLPLAAVVSGSLFCAHGGISPLLNDIEVINSFSRFTEPTYTGVFCDLLWSDPNPKLSTREYYTHNSQRNCSYFYSQRAIDKFLKLNKLKCIVRGHEVQSTGYRLYNTEKYNQTLITIFSAPNYCDVYKNQGAYLKFDGTITIVKFSAVEHPFYLNNYLDAINWSFPFVCEKASEFFLDLIKYMDKKEPKRRLIRSTQTFTGSMAIMRNERECGDELNDEESSEMPCCSLKNIDKDISFDEAKILDEYNEILKAKEDIVCGNSVNMAPSCTNEVIRMLNEVELIKGIEGAKIDVDETKKTMEIKLKKNGK